MEFAVFLIILLCLFSCVDNNTGTKESPIKKEGKKALDIMYYDEAFHKVEIVKESTTIDSQLTYVKYAIYEYTMEEQFIGVVESEVPALLKYKSYFTLGKDTLYVASCYEHDLATYNVELLETTVFKDKYHITYFNDCGACANPTEYTIAIANKQTPKIYLVEERLAND